MSDWFHRVPGNISPANIVPGNIVQCVPEQIAPCEFDCRSPKCSVGEWETCERRLIRTNVPKPIVTQPDEKLANPL